MKYEMICEYMTIEELNQLKTRQLLNHLNATRSWGEWFWEDEQWNKLKEYQTTIKSILATREHIPNKQESKMLRKERKKRGV